MKIKVACCDVCGALTKLPDAFDEVSEDPLEYRCAIVRAACIGQSGDPVECDGVSRFIGYMDLWDRT